ncbi:hypothetical protein BGZ47_003496, partial [Haplosporangium gracile]
TISSWIVGPATQAIATVPRPILYNNYDTLPSVYRNQPQIQQYVHYLQDANDSDDDEDDYFVVNKSSDEDVGDTRDTTTTTAAAISTAQRTAERKNEGSSNNNRISQQQPTTQGRGVEQEDSDATASDADSIFDAIVPQQADDGNSSSIARVPSGQLRSRKP